MKFAHALPPVKGSRGQIFVQAITTKPSTMHSNKWKTKPEMPVALSLMYPAKMSLSERLARVARYIHTVINHKMRCSCFVSATESTAIRRATEIPK